jgi:hypothetical protein
MRAQRGGGTYSPDKSYKLASWEDYQAWLERIGYVVTLVQGQGIVIHTENADIAFSTRRELYYWLVDGEGASEYLTEKSMCDNLTDRELLQQDLDDHKENADV